MLLPTTCLSGEQTDLCLPATAGPSSVLHNTPPQTRHMSRARPPLRSDKDQKMSTRVHTRPSARETPPQTRAPFQLDPQQVMYTAYLFPGLCPTKSKPPVPLLPAKPGNTSFLNLRLQQRQQEKLQRPEGKELPSRRRATLTACFCGDAITEGRFCIWSDKGFKDLRCNYGKEKERPRRWKEL